MATVMIANGSRSTLAHHAFRIRCQVHVTALANFHSDCMIRQFRTVIGTPPACFPDIFNTACRSVSK
jgi:hypothetical protein